MIPHQSLTIQYREAPPPPAPASEAIRVVELPFSVLYDCCELGLDDVAVAEAAIRRESSAGVFDRKVPSGFLQTLDDDSTDAVLRAALQLNIEQPEGRAGKLAGLIVERRRILFGQPRKTPVASNVEPSTASSAPSSSSSPTDTPSPANTPAAN